MEVVVITPADPVVTLDEVKAHLRLTGTDQDTLLTAYRAAAQGQIDGPDGWLGRAIGPQTLELQGVDLVDSCAGIILPFAPVTGVVSVVYGEGQTMDAAGYVFGPGAVLRPKAGTAWPWLPGQGTAVQVRYTAGYAIVPAAIKAAVLLLTQDLYLLSDRDPALTSETVYGVSSQMFSAAAAPLLSQTAQRLLAPFRIFAV